MPARTIEPNFTVTLQKLLGVTNIMLPFLAEMHALDDTVNGVITEVRVE